MFGKSLIFERSMSLLGFSITFVDANAAPFACLGLVIIQLIVCYDTSDALHNYLQYVTNLGFETKPDYKYCKKLFRNGIREVGYQDDGRLTFTHHAKKSKKVTFLN